MSKFTCTCGHVISDVQVPNEVTGFILSDKSGDLLSRTIENVLHDYLKCKNGDDITEFCNKYLGDEYPKSISMEDIIHDVLISYFFDVTLAVMECDNCYSLWIQRNPEENYYMQYSPQPSSKDQNHKRKKILGFNASKNILEKIQDS